MTKGKTESPRRLATPDGCELVTGQNDTKFFFFFSLSDQIRSDQSSTAVVPTNTGGVCYHSTGTYSVMKW
jgi:hypothetical protein